MTVQAKKIHDNPSAEELRKFTEEMPSTRITEFDNVNVPPCLSLTFQGGPPAAPLTVARASEASAARDTTASARRRQVDLGPCRRTVGEPILPPSVVA